MTPAANPAEGRARALLGDHGPLARRFAGYESRPGQLEMADAVERALGEERILLCEAGTGTGKTLAYLVPAILSGRKVVVSTATRALQEQIAERDVPLIRELLGLEVRLAVMKGLSNYLCLRRFEEVRRSPAALDGKRPHALNVLERWRERTVRGDLGELSELAEDDPALQDVASSSETRLGPGCGHFDECFVTRRKREAEAAQLVVVNHHLFFADLALRGPHPGHVIPDYDAVIFDEAHQLEDTATTFFGVRISSARIERVLRDLERAAIIAQGSASRAGEAPLIAAARRRADELWSEIRRALKGSDAPEGRTTMEREHWAGPLAERWHALDGALDGVVALANELGGRLGAGRERAARGRDPRGLVEALEVGARRAEDIRTDLAAAIDGAPGRVTWFEQGARGAVLSSSPVDVSGIFREQVFGKIPAVVLTSATLATGGSVAPPVGPASAPVTGAFSYLRSRLGLNDDALAVEEQLVPSPFDFDQNAIFYTPRDLPDPRAAEFVDTAAERIRALVELTGGGAFVLTTSNRSMRALAARLREACAASLVLLQGEAPKGTLLERFRSHGDAVLVATQSFWEGVDIPGSALRLVVLEKIPFAVPTDPVIRARSARIEAEGGNPFMTLHVPAAALALKQGFGRLIRTRSDRGIVALLDERVHKKGYGRHLLAALPPARRSDDLGEVARRWREIEARP